MTLEFDVWGFLVGDRLPAEQSIGCLEVTQTIPEQLRRLARVGRGGLRAEAPDAPAWVAGSGAYTTVRSQHAFHTVVMAETQYRAPEIVDEDVLPPVLAGLTALNGSTVEGEVVMVRPTDQPNGQAYGMASATAAIRSSIPTTIHDERWIARANELTHAAMHDSTASRAAREIQLANRHRWVIGDEVVNAQAVLLTYFFVIERIAKRVAKVGSWAVDATRQEMLADGLLNSLRTHRSAKVRVKQIRNAAVELDRLEYNFVKQRISRAGAELGLSTTMVMEAGRFTDLRNRQLGHATALGAGPQREVFGYLDKAGELARAFLTAYLARIADQGVTIS